MDARFRSWLMGGYLVLAGWTLTLLPWSSAWFALAWSLPSAWARILAHPACRGAVSGFGVLHFAVALLLAGSGRERS
ncbi:MAG: hypothetical protein ACP5NF_10290 [Thermoanaerobaculum sp.]